MDSSALLSVVLTESDHDVMVAALADATQLRVSAATWLEAAIVVDSVKNPGAPARFDDLITDLAFEIVPVTAELAKVARLAYARFGKGRHKAKLNFGDCCSYALAVSLNEPLLFKGNDFSQTDIEPALA